jgi:ubiquinone/menaquinone biosynthesis C-methylase UbiE
MLMDASGSEESNRKYYDAFSKGYEDNRGDNDPGGYHDLLDELEADFVHRYGAGHDILEVGCGTGLVLERISQFARTAKGVDLSPGMLEKAKARQLDVQEGSATKLPFPDSSFDVTCSFKVLAHVPDIEQALAEMARVTRPGGHILAEFYNPYSFRALIKHWGPAKRVSDAAAETDVFTRFDSPRRIRELAPPGCVLVNARGVRITVPTARFMQGRFGRGLFRTLEWALCDTPMKFFAGFYVAVFQKRN